MKLALTAVTTKKGTTIGRSGPDSCHSHRPPNHLPSLLDSIQAFSCHTAYATAILQLRVAWHYLLPGPVASTGSQQPSCWWHHKHDLWCLTGSTTDAVTAPRYNTTRWQTHWDKDKQARQCVHRHTQACTAQKCVVFLTVEATSWRQMLNFYTCCSKIVFFI